MKCYKKGNVEAIMYKTMIVKNYENIIGAYVTRIARVRFFVLQFCHVATILNGLMPCNKEQPTRNTMV